MEKYKKLFNNSLVFAIGNFGSKIINFIMVPLYTYTLTTQQYGTLDLITTTVNLLVPFVTLTIEQAVIRFAVQKVKDRPDDYILTTSLFFCAFMNSISLILILFLFHFFGFNMQYQFYFIVLIILNSFQSILLQFTRGIEKIKEFAINGILQTILIAGFNILFLVNFKMGLVGYFKSLILSILLSILYLVFVIKAWKRISIKYFDFEFLKDMLVYSIPLLPNNTMWWLVNNSTRYIILYFLGASANGLFAVANKIPSLITMLTSIFQQAWQLSAFEEYESSDRSVFYSTIFKYYYQFLILSGIILVTLSQPIVYYFVEYSYYESWKIIPPLILAVIYQTFSGFIGTIYTASMKTRGMFISSILSAFVAVFANLLFIPIFGLTGAGIGTTLAFIIMWIYRLIDTRKYVTITIDYVCFFFNNILFIFQWIILTADFDISLKLKYSLAVFVLCASLILNRKLVDTFIFRLFRKSH